MKADTSRATFDPRKHYQGVYLQQGRVQLDSDWNEQVALTTHRERERARDLVGRVGVPRVAAGFKCTPTANGRDLSISPGRIHVTGQVCQNDTAVTLSSQPHWPVGAPLVVTEEKHLPLAQIPDGRYLVHLDVWQRPVTALEDPDLLEPALGGADTTFRTQMVWQVGLVALAPGARQGHCQSPLPPWFQSRMASTGSLTAKLDSAPPAVDDCELSPTTAYRGPENQHYRVEIHTAGPDGKASFKWSRENGSVVVPWAARNGRQLTMGSAAGDLQRRFASGDTIELLSDNHILQGIPGVILTVEGIADDRLIIAEAPSQIPDLDSFGRHPRIRLWEGGPPKTVTAASPLPLEAGILVTFGKGHYRSGDYWSIPARTQSAGLLWPEDAGGQPAVRPAAGIRHTGAKLAVVTASGGELKVAADCRPLFPPLTDIRASDVSFDNDSCGTDLQNAHTVQDAIEVLCQRPAGGDDNAKTCEIRIDPQEGIPLEERVKKLVGAGRQHICLCLAPGEHFTKASLELTSERHPLHTLHLRGCGAASKLSLGDALALTLPSLRIEGLHLDAGTDTGPIILGGDGEIHLVENLFTGQLDNAAPLLLISSTGEIHISDNRLLPSSPGRRQKLKYLFPTEVLKESIEPSAFLDPRWFRKALEPVIAKMTALSHVQREKATDQWKRRLHERGGLSEAVETQIDRIRSILMTDGVTSRNLSRQLEALRMIALTEAPAVALAITDGDAHVHLLENVLDGDLLLYGRKAGGMEKIALENLLNVQIASESDGSLNASGNRFTRVQLAAELTDKIKVEIETGKFGVEFDLFRRVGWRNNQFRSPESTMAAEVANFSDNHFMTMLMPTKILVTSFAQQATFTGNIGPRPEKKNDEGIVLDFSSTAATGKGRAGNLLRFIP